MHDDGSVQLARYDFLLMFYSDLRSMWNHCRVINTVKIVYRRQQQEKQRREVSTERATYFVSLTARDAATYTLAVATARSCGGWVT